jgi:peptidoglycan/xylan/chitin deacetylase (PgdA/CDA1 family)
MHRHGTNIVKAALSAAYFMGADGWLAPLTRGQGVIFTLHHVRPDPPRAFEPNRILKVTPEFLDTVIGQVVSAGFELIPLDGIPDRLKPGYDGPPFACFTLDDGYRDNHTYAYPIFQRHNAPFAIYVPTDYADGRGDLWWLVLETVITQAPHVSIQMDGALHHFSTRTDGEKETAFNAIYWWLRRIPEDRARFVVAELAQSIGYDAASLCADLVMGWDELRTLAADPLVTIGAHTRRHYALAKVDAEDARREMVESAARIEAELGRPCRHFSYPYGCAKSAGRREFDLAEQAGFATAVTTQKGLIQRRHSRSMTALPRLSLNGDFQDLRYIKVMLSGAPFAVWNAMQRG